MLPRRAVSTSEDYNMVAIGAPTGGLHVLSQAFRELSTEFHLPIVITQHLPVSFMPYFASQIALLAGRPATWRSIGCDSPGSDQHRAGRCASENRETVRRRSSAPSQARVGGKRLHTRGRPDDGLARRRLRSTLARGCAERHGARRRGGARRVHDSGGCVVVQDRQSSVVWGMPGAIGSAGVADAVLAPGAIDRLVATARRQ
ncbi:hypothetical protein QFZ54_000697 [Sphingomonas faeni]|nr:hypothetical protein [Sphingomonas faeni]